MANSLLVGSFPISHSPTDNEVESSLPSTSAVAHPAHPSSNCYHDVFINHRGPDVKKGFASLLYYRLISQKLRVFLDKSELRKGEKITPQIERAIRTASVHVAIFSEHYAESAWCLDELVLMKESGSVILPVFYDVKPYELRRRRGGNSRLRRRGGGNSRYAKALRDLEKKKDEGKPRYNSATIEKWRNALNHVAEISGFELEAYNGDQGELLEAVVKIVLEKVVEDQEKQILPREKEQQTLKICYNGLEEDEKNVFLDIVSFFIGEKRDTAIRVWDGSGWDGSRLFQNLLNKSLVEVDSENEIKMHDRIRDMGREIVGEVSLRRGFRRTENIDDLLQQLYNAHGAITKVRGIRTGITTARDHKPWYRRIIHNLPANSLHSTDLELLDVNDGRLVCDLVRHSPNLIWLRWQNCSYSSLPHLGSVEKLRVFEVSSSVLKKLWKSQAVPLQLRELVVKSPLSELPDSTGQLQHLELIILDCPSGNLKTLPYEFCHLQSLKRCELKNCAEIKSLPQSFGSLTNLEYIDLSGSKELERLPDSFGKLCSLKCFKLTDCLKIKSLPDSLGSLANLEHIDLSRSENLQSLPDSFGDLIRLKYLDLSCCNNLTISSNTLGNISTLEYINLSSCWKVEVLPLQVARQRSLQKLYCPFLEMVPSLLDGNLQELKLRNGRNDNELRCLPISAGRLNQLTKLTVNECELRERTLSNLGSSIDMSKLLHFFCEENEMPKLLQLRHIELYKTKISEISFAEGFCPKLQHLLIKSCDHLEKVGTLPNALIKLELTRCSKLEKIEGLCGLEKLQTLNIRRCRKMKQLSNIEKLESLEVLDVNGCMNLKSIRLDQAEKSQLTKLRRLEIVKCSQLEELRGVERLKSLERLDVSGCTQLKWDEEVLEQLQRQLGPRFIR